MAQKAPLLTAKVVGDLPTPSSNKFHSFRGYEAEFIEDSLSARKKRTEAAPGGFGVVVTPAGGKSYVFNYIVAGKERRITLGKCAAHEPPAAINWARGLRQRLDSELGFDPLAVKQARPAAQETTLSELFQQWADSRKERSISQRGAFRNHICPAVLSRFKPRKLGDVPFKEITKPDIAELHRLIRKTGDVIADTAVRYLGAVLNWQARTNEETWVAPTLPPPCYDTEAAERDHTLSDDDIRTLWPVWETEAAGRNGQLARLLLLTGCRRNEIAEAMWGEVDLDGATMHVPAERYKTRRATTLALSAPAVAILKGISDAGRRKDGRVFATWSFARAKDQLDKLCRREPDWHFHDLRRTAGSIMYAEGISAEDCDEVLGHVRRKITRVYLRDRNRGGDFMDRKRKAVDVLASAINRIVPVAGMPPQPESNVVELRVAAV